MAKRAVLVTGASRGIGRAVAQAFAELGDRVAVHHRDSAGLARTSGPGCAERSAASPGIRPTGPARRA